MYQEALIKYEIIRTMNAFILVRYLNHIPRFCDSSTTYLKELFKDKTTSIPTIGLPLEIYLEDQTIYTSKVQVILSLNDITPCL